MKWFSILLFLSVACYSADSWVVSQTNWDTTIKLIKAGDTVYIDWNDTPTIYRAWDILDYDRLGCIETYYSWGKEVRNKTGYTDYYLIIRRVGKNEIIRK